MWGEYKRHWPDTNERPSVDWIEPPAPGAATATDLKSSDNERIEAEYSRMRIGRRKDRASDACRWRAEIQHRHLVGFEHHLKGLDRIKEKVHEDMELLGRSPSEAISLLPDAIRYTFQYEEARYTQGVWADIARMQEQGFKLDMLKNMWSDDQYKGIQ